MMTRKAGDIVMGIANVPMGWLFVLTDWGDDPPVLRLKTNTSYVKFIEITGNIHINFDASKLDTKRCTLVADVSTALYNSLLTHQREVLS